MAIPPPLDEDHRIATAREIRSWSYGRLTAQREKSATFADNIRGTLHDQGIFGPQKDFECACGKYAGREHSKMVCDLCRVKIGGTTIRRERFGHIDFPVPVVHPFDETCSMECFPVLPNPYTATQGGSQLLKLYDQLIFETASKQKSPDRITEVVAAILDRLRPIAIDAVRWQLVDAEILLQGMALTRKSRHGDGQYCERCGYLLDGLNTTQCPQCGARLS